MNMMSEYLNDEDDEFMMNNPIYPHLSPSNDSSEFDQSCDSSFRNRQSSEPAPLFTNESMIPEIKAVSLMDFQDSSREINKITLNRTPTAMDILKAEEVPIIRGSQQDWMDNSRFRCASTPAVNKNFLLNSAFMMEDE